MNGNLENILNNKNFTKEQKIQAINQYYENYRNQTDKELNDSLTKLYAGSILEIASAALPMGGAGKIGGMAGKELLKKQLGRKISENIGAGIMSGAASGGLFGLGESLINETNPVLSSLQGILTGGITGGPLGSVGSNLQKTIKGQQLKNYGDIDELNKILRKQYNNDARKFYQDYIQEIQINKNGQFDFTKRGIQEQMRWNPHQAQNFPELVNDIKNAKRLPDVPNTKPLEKPLVSHYEVYRGEKGDYYIEVMKDNSKRFYITKDAYAGTPHATSTGSNASIGTSSQSPNNIIPFADTNFNPESPNTVLYGKVEKNVNNGKTDLSGYKNPLTGNNRIFTREEVGHMSKEEYAKYEKEIDAQMEYFNGTMPTNEDLAQEATNGGGVVYVNSYTRSDGTKVRGYYRSK